jgi:hypothetical protein
MPSVRIAQATISVQQLGSKWTKPGERFRVYINVSTHRQQFLGTERGPFAPGDIWGMVSDLAALAHWQSEIAAAQNVYHAYSRNWRGLDYDAINRVMDRLKHLFHEDRGEAGRFLWCPGCKATPEPTEPSSVAAPTVSENGQSGGKAALVYQAGIANVFDETGDAKRRLLQSDFRSCESFARGLGAAGYSVRSVHCNRAGDIAAETWSETLEDAPFRESMHPVITNGTARQDTTYNGWKNYETWAVHLWLSNEEPLYHEARELADAEYEYPTMGPCDAFKEWVEEMMPALEEGSLQADLLGAALSEVDWLEVVEAFKEENQ